LHTSIITNGTLLESRLHEISPYINGVVGRYDAQKVGKD